MVHHHPLDKLHAALETAVGHVATTDAHALDKAREHQAQADAQRAAQANSDAATPGQGVTGG